MTRAVPEWIGPRPETSAPPRVKARICDRQGGKCATCQRKLGMAGEPVEFDHVRALINGGENREANLQGLCGLCHITKTREDVAIKKKTARVRAKHMGFASPKRGIPYRRFDGEAVWPERHKKGTDE